tara:strand:- start:1998 stop:2267 length:270 start_codon:yes stop_codon:yes gene_type:complete
MEKENDMSYKIYGEISYRTFDGSGESGNEDFEIITDEKPETYEDVAELVADNVEYVGEYCIPVMQLDGEFGDFEVEWYSVEEELQEELV